MLVISLEKGENPERAIKRYKTKCDRTGLSKQMRARRRFKKPSLKRRMELLKAIHRQRFLQQQA